MTKQIATVTFHGTPLTVITQDGQQLVAMRPIIEAIGLGWQSQYNRIQRHPVLKSTVVMMNTVAQDGKQRQLLCLPLDYLNGWLFGVDVNRVREEIRDTLIQYQRECYQVLADYWQKGEAKAQGELTYTPSLMGRRWLVSFDHNNQEHVTPVPDDAYVLSHADLLKALTRPNDSYITTEELCEFMAAATEQLKRRNVWQSKQLQAARASGYKPR